MFEISHMTVGALSEVGLKRKLPTAIVAFSSHAILDSSDIWHAPYPWPEDSPSILHFMPYPHNVSSILTLIMLIVVTIAVAFLLRHYWWGMIWSSAPDLIDWIILRPITGQQPIHNLFDKVTTPWGFGLEIAFVAVIIVVLMQIRYTSLAKTSK